MQFYVEGKENPKGTWSPGIWDEVRRTPCAGLCPKGTWSQFCQDGVPALNAVASANPRFSPRTPAVPILLIPGLEASGASLAQEDWFTVKSTLESFLWPYSTLCSWLPHIQLNAFIFWETNLRRNHGICLKVIFKEAEILQASTRFLVVGNSLSVRACVSDTCFVEIVLCRVILRNANPFLGLLCSFLPRRHCAALNRLPSLYGLKLLITLHLLLSK